MPTLHFPFDQVKILLDHARAAPEHQGCYTEKSEQAELWIVGDTGIYLMSNGKPHLPKPGAKSPDHSFVVYADECNPETDPDGWWDAKGHYFGHDDGADGIPVKLIDDMVHEYVAKAGMQPLKFGINITSRSMRFVLA